MADQSILLALRSASTSAGVISGTSTCSNSPPLNQTMSSSRESRRPRAWPEELGDRVGELAAVALALVDDALEELARQQADVFGKHAEEALDEEVGDLLGVVAAGGHRLGDVGKAAGGVGGDVEHRAAGAKLFGVGGTASAACWFSGVPMSSRRMVCVSSGYR